jgi:replicative DNA helicase
VSAQNRAGYRSRALESFKESGGIEHGADVAAVLSRDREGSSTPTSQALGLNVIKDRNGERGAVGLRFYAEQARFEEVSKKGLAEDEDD